ncbi:putative DNA mismatch repair protein mlh1 [Radiomyces spectabilis]|uniref:putative DNA mismatch repair protein mlh1 n=1 Tax=Radiomyces spectabilis TaxID=64574 RepID=UPI00221F6918|nr:putative DNA mismatch repair protein mlh1 [Radiomyces spectabilis]KAI8384686.1 putative DNA mismatch repair protein mlh1 [Radiomyces spectabilis]
MTSPKSPPTIKRLEQTVVNRIAAGEIIHRPANALKELIENSLDAGSTQIQILVKDGGLKLLQIQDNGHGIRREDMGIVCERFTTSKLRKFDDLSQIATHGFRGEALASISHVAHVTITTKTAESKCAFRATYSDGKLVPPRPGQSADPKPCAGNDGTQITAEDLFYNVPTRRKALKSPSEEYNRILDIVSRYAVHNAGVAFTCRKQGTTAADIQTISSASTVDTIRQIYGSSVANELLPVEREFPELEFKMSAYVSNANYSTKRMTLLLFINNRAVESSSIKKMIEGVYAALLPKGAHPFVYLSLEINPRNVDVNVHPTKREVHFLNEEHVVNAVSDAFQNRLENANTSRTFLTQTLLPGVLDIPEPSSAPKPAKVAVYNTVRTDGRLNTLDTFLDPSVPSKRLQSTSSTDGTNNGQEQDDAVSQVDELNSRGMTPKVKRPRIEVRLTSVLNLRKEVKRSEHTGITALFSNHTFVGCVDDALALIQHERSLYLVNYAVASEELFYQVVLNEFCNFGRLNLSEPVDIRASVLLAIEAEERKGNLPDQLRSADEIAKAISDTMVSRAEMLEEYFCMTVTEDGHLKSLPMLLRGYIPTMDKLPMFLLRLGTEVDWETERGCFETLARELAVFFCAEPPLKVGETEEDETLYKEQHERYLWQVQHLIFPSFKTHFVASGRLGKSGDESGTTKFITQLANLADLYKIFERC